VKKLDLILDMLVYEGNQTNDPTDADKIKGKIQETEILEVIRNKLSLADATVDQVVALPENPSTYLVILVDRQVSIKINGISTAITLSPHANGKKTPAFYWRGSITALTVSNASGAAANVDIILMSK